MLSYATGMPIIDAHDDFIRARRAHRIRRASGWLSRRPRCANHPRLLGDATGAPHAPTRLEVIPLSEIVGTVEPSVHFDARFRPGSEHLRARWERIALAHRRGATLPPISVVRRPDGYYVVDGRHRVSVALALGLHEIDAWTGAG
jgi:hypothetical protein